MKHGDLSIIPTSSKLLDTFLVAFIQEEKFLVARCPELGVTSQGETLDEAKANIKEAIELYIESFGLEDLPKETSRPFWTTVEIAHS
ncbi:MAG: type II toxin-antitoxin system HicB family antitoxin [Candidatus Heimdallarchaeota archaeon]